MPCLRNQLVRRVDPHNPHPSLHKAQRTETTLSSQRKNRLRQLARSNRGVEKYSIGSSGREICEARAQESGLRYLGRIPIHYKASSAVKYISGLCKSQ